jgi:predicted DNA binding CopG/RHH family protein
MKKLKKIPKFKNEDKEREFWATHDSTEYLDLSKAKSMRFPNLKPSSRSVPIRFPLPLLERIKILSNKKHIPYQSLLKIYLSERVEQELHRKF